MSKEEYKDAIEVSVIFHKGQRMFAVPKQPAQQEPVAWMYQHPNNRLKTCYQTYKPNGECVPLYTSPPAQRKPLTDEQIEALDCINSLWDDGESCTIIGIKEFARKIEAAHNIKENT